MTTRSRRRQAGKSEAELKDAIAVKAAAARDAMGKAGPDQCPLCLEPHHTDILPPLFKPTDTLATTGMTDPAVKDAVWHIVIEVYRYAEANRGHEEAIADLGLVMTAVAMVGSGCEAYGKGAGVREFFDQLVVRSGYGRYVLDIGPNGVQSAGSRLS